MKPHLTTTARSRKLLAFLLVIFFSVTAAMAQKQYTVKLLDPASGSDIIKGQMYTVKFRIKNTGTMAISMMDTIAVEIMIGMDMPYMGGTMYPLNPGDSVDMQITNFSYSNFSADASASFCLTVEIFGNNHPNPADKSSCQNVNLKMSPTGIGSTELETGVMLFPNPADQSFQVKCSKNSESILSLYDLSGKKINETVISGSDATITTAQYPEGIYMYRLSDKNTGTTTTGRMIVKH